MTPATWPCCGCGADIASMPGNYYCNHCVADQRRAYRSERQAFNDYHAYADSCARGREAGTIN